MNTFSLLLESPDQTISLASLEEASDVLTSLVRADCVRLHRDMGVIFISGLGREEAVAFQAALKGRGFPTTVVDDDDLPVLHESFQIQRIELKDETLVLTNSSGRVRVRALTDLVFLAAGYVCRIECRNEWKQHLEFSGPRGGPMMVNERQYREDSETDLRVDFFFWSEPNRLHALLGTDTVVFFQGEPLRLRHAAALGEMLHKLSELLPEKRRNTFLRDPAGRGAYANLHSYQKEIRWHFHTLEKEA